MAKWCFSDVLNESSDTSSLLTKRSSVKDSMKTKLLKNVLFKLESLGSLTATEAIRMEEHLKSVSLPADMQEAISDTVDSMLGEADQHQATTVVSLKPQTLVHLSMFLTGPDWAVLEDSSCGWWTKEKLLVDRLKKLGFRSMSEKTVGASVALLACTLTSCPPESELHKISVEMKACFQTTEACPAHLPIVIKYPEHPSKLPQKLYDHSYKEHEPEPRHVEQFAHIRGLKFLRTSSSKVGGKRKSSEAASSAGGMQQFKSCQGDMDGNPMMGMMGMMMNMCQNMCEAMGKCDRKPAVNITNCRQASTNQFRPKGLQMLAAGETKHTSPAKTAGLPAIEGPKEAEPVEEAEPSEEEEVAKECEDEEPDTTEPQKKNFNIEQKLYESLQQNKKQAKEAAAVATKAKAEAKAKAKAKGKAKATKKAIAKAKTSKGGKLPDYNPPSPTKEQLKKMRETYTDGHYHKARLMAKALGYSAEDEKAYGRKARQAAAQKWQSHM